MPKPKSRARRHAQDVAVEEEPAAKRKASAKPHKVAAAPAFDALKSVVQIINNANAYDYTAPYFPPRQSSWSGSGVVVAGQGIITNAHVATDSERLYVRLAGTDKLYLAYVDKAGIGQDCDLAMLRVDDPEFWARTQPVDIAEEFAPTGSHIHVLGFPVGGRTLNHTLGIVGRLDHQDYVHSGKELAVQQVDAAINPGNSGGPAIVDDKVAGIAFQGYSTYQNISYIIPAPVVRHYIEEVNRGQYKGFPELDITTQSLHNETLRNLVSMRSTDTGLLINRISSSSSAFKHLQVGDVILAIEGQNITDFGSVTVDGQRLIDMQHLANMKFIGDTLSVTVLRDNKVKTVSFKLKNSLMDSSLVPMEYNKTPTYYANSGLVFQPLTFNYFLDLLERCRQSSGLRTEKAMLAEQSLSNIGDMMAYAKKREKTVESSSSIPKRQIVFISNIFPLKETEGFGMYREIPVMSINGRPIMNMADIIRAMESNKEPEHVIVLGNDAVIAVPNIPKKRNDEINTHFGVHLERSADLKQLPDEDHSSSDMLLQILAMAGIGPEEALWPDEGSDVDPDFDPDAPATDDEAAEGSEDGQSMSGDESEEEGEDLEAEVEYLIRSQRAPAMLSYHQMIAEKQAHEQALMQRKMALEEQSASQQQLFQLKMSM